MEKIEMRWQIEKEIKEKKAAKANADKLLPKPEEVPVAALPKEGEGNKFAGFF